MQTSQQTWVYDGTAGATYERILVPEIFAPWARDLVARADVRPGDRVLDVACGTGAVTREVAARLAGAGRLVGLELSAGMLAAARAASDGLPITWHEGDATALPFESDAFDWVFCQQGLQFFPNKPAALREMRRVLAPGGRVLLSVWRTTRNNPGYLALEEALARQVGAPVALPPFALGDAGLLRALLLEAGFRRVGIRAEAKMTRFPSVDAFVRGTAAAAPTMLGPLAEQGEAGLARIVADLDAALATSCDDDGVAFPLVSNVVTTYA